MQLFCLSIGGLAESIKIPGSVQKLSLIAQ